MLPELPHEQILVFQDLMLNERVFQLDSTIGAHFLAYLVDKEIACRLLHLQVTFLEMVNAIPDRLSSGL